MPSSANNNKLGTKKPVSKLFFTHCLPRSLVGFGSATRSLTGYRAGVSLRTPLELRSWSSDHKGRGRPGIRIISKGRFSIVPAFSPVVRSPSFFPPSPIFHCKYFERWLIFRYHNSYFTPLSKFCTVMGIPGQFLFLECFRCGRVVAGA